MTLFPGIYKHICFIIENPSNALAAAFLSVKIVRLQF